MIDQTNEDCRNFWVFNRLEAEFAEKLRLLVEKHKEESASAQPVGEVTADADADAATTGSPLADTIADPNEQEAKEKKMAKARRKREKAREKEIERQTALEKQQQEAGPSAREQEMASICLPDQMEIVDTIADGHCLYRSVAAQVEASTYQSVREMCAESLLQHRAELEAFVETDTPFEDYVENVRSTATWGGSLELRALALSLRRPIVVYSTASQPLVMGDEFQDGSESVSPIRLSYHLHYYALGAHYNLVVEKKRVALDGDT